MDADSPTLQALGAFVASQHALLARTRADLARLTHLRDNPEEHTIEDVFHVTRNAVLPFEEIAAAAARPLDAIDWSTFEACDPAALHELARSTNQSRERLSVPSTTQSTPLAPLQLLVRGARKVLLDPVFHALDLSYDPPPPPARLLPDPRTLERARIRALKNQRFAGGGGGAGLTVRRDGVYIRRDVADESVLVNVDMVADLSALGPEPLAEQLKLEGEEYISEPPLKRPAVKTSRTRHPTHPAPKPPKKRKTAKNAKDPEPPPTDGPVLPDAPVPGKKAKAKSETFKLAWSVEEQHLLEQLLEKFPEGSKNRWLQISRAMNGRRTPRQVASRVQKYFEKLKRFGLEAEGAGVGVVDDEDEDE